MDEWDIVAPAFVMIGGLVLHFIWHYAWLKVAAKKIILKK
ncbi:hypothetical protein D081_1174 [Anaerovibrio sp. JC8]|nr:hypothetical protein D081_1174 [Anaerovibrio sp. JC8]